MYAGCSFCPVKPCDPTKLTDNGDTWMPQQWCFVVFPSSGYVFLLFFTCAASFLCCLHNWQAFIKQLGEGVSFPWSSCQLFPISLAPWKTLKATNFLGLGLSLGLELGLGYRLCVQDRGLSQRNTLALQSLGLDSVLMSTDRH